MDSMDLKDFRIRYYNKLIEKYNTNQQYLEWNDIIPLNNKSCDNSIMRDMDDFEDLSIEKINELKSKIVIVKLNGGLSTSMYTQTQIQIQDNKETTENKDKKISKCFLKVDENKSFLDIVIEQSKKENIPLILMNSFYTNEETIQYLHEIHNDNIRTFSQFSFPRICKKTGRPFIADCNEPIKDINDWYPCGHGDLLFSLYYSEILDELYKTRIEYIFVSNIDNLGAIIDYKILGEIDKSGADFILETTVKTKEDVKGGTLIKYKDKYQMFEIAQCPIDKIDEFKSTDKFKYFNTNNLWIRISAIRDLFKNGIQLSILDDINIIVNPKKRNGDECIQLEYAIGSFVNLFDPTKIMNIIVDRARFIPVKTMDNLYNLRKRIARNKMHHLNRNMRFRVMEYVFADLRKKYRAKLVDQICDIKIADYRNSSYIRKRPVVAKTIIEKFFYENTKFPLFVLSQDDIEANNTVLLDKYEKLNNYLYDLFMTEISKYLIEHYYQFKHINARFMCFHRHDFIYRIVDNRMKYVIMLYTDFVCVD